MINSLKPRISFANVVALLALFVALGGSAYAVSKGEIRSRHIADDNVRSKDLRDNSVKTQDLKDGHVRGDDIAETAVDNRHLAPASVGGEQVDENAIDNRHIAPGAIGGNEVRDATLGAQHLVLKCGPTAKNIDGLCFESAARAAVDSVHAAEQACSAAGGRLPTALQLRGAMREIGFGNDPLWSDAAYYDGGAFRSIVVRGNGATIAGAPGDSNGYICVFEPLT